VGEFAKVIPAQVISSVIGLDLSDPVVRYEAGDLNRAIARWSSSLTREHDVVTEARAASERLSGILRPLVRARQTNRDDDFVSAMWAAGSHVFRDWNEADVMAACRVLYFAGQDTTTHLLSNAAFLIFSDRALRARLESDPSQIPGLVEETLRAVAVVQLRRRVATRDLELGSQRIKRGQSVLAILGAANRDPNRYDNPMQINLERPGFADILLLGPACAYAREPRSPGTRPPMPSKASCAASRCGTRQLTRGSPLCLRRPGGRTHRPAAPAAGRAPISMLQRDKIASAGRPFNG
jgi:cytochrome P450